MAQPVEQARRGPLPLPQSGGGQPALVRLAQAGDLDAFAALVRAHERRIYRGAWLITSDHHEAEDLAQEVFMRAHKALPSLRDVDRFSEWLFSIAHNTRTDWVRRRVARPNGRAVPLLAEADAGPGGEATPDATAAAAETRGQVAQAVSGLPEALRHVIVLRYVEGLSYVRIAAVLDVSPSVVGERLHRARKKLADRLAGLQETGGVA